MILVAIIYIMTEYFKLVPHDPTTSSKLIIARNHPDSEHIQPTIMGWKRLLPNKVQVPLVNPQFGSHQCTALDNHCYILVAISFKIYDKIYNHILKSSQICLNKQLKERALYVIDSIQCKVTVDQFSAFMKLQVQNKKLRFISDIARFQALITEQLVLVQPFNSFVKINFSSFSHQFLRFFCQTLKWAPKFRSSYCICTFNSKMDQDLFLVSISDSFLESSTSSSQIKIVSNVVTTPRAAKQLKKDGSDSSLVSNNKSRSKNRQKVKISERLNLKKSFTTIETHKNKECLNIFEQENNGDTQKGNQQTIILKQSDASMDLRGSFEQLEKNVDEDKLSNHSFKQKNKEFGVSPKDQQNKKLRHQNAQLRKQLESMSQAVKEAATVKKKYLNAVQQLNRLQNERIAIVKDKMKFESAYYEQKHEKEALRKQLQHLRARLGEQRFPQRF